MDDWQLLSSYATGGSEEAFSELVTRHLGFVYNVALRRLNGDAHLAEDVAQLVFTNLARKAHSLQPEVILAGWLHRDTCFTALEVQRRERRRRAREQTAFHMRELNDNALPVDWQEICPWLDEALHQLPATDRDALLLRFFEKRSLAEIGQKLGSGESGASRRVSRALEKLRGLLAKRGLVTTSAALSAALCAQVAQAVPSSLASTLSAASLAAALSPNTHLSILTLMASMKLKIGLAVLVGAAVIVPVALTRHTHFKQASQEEFREQERSHVLQAAQQMAQLLTYAGNHNNKLPDTFGEAGLNSDQFEFVFRDTLPSDENNLSSTIVIREKKAWQTAQGTWAKTYGYADGHSQVWVTPDGNFGQ
jgi:RNA polymerase sigma factor (sigma-70 family)